MKVDELCVCLPEKLGYLLLILHTFLFLARFPVEFVNSNFNSRFNFYLEEPGVGGSAVIS